MILHEGYMHFVSSIWLVLWDLIGTTVLFANVYHPQMDGKVKFAYHTIEQVVQYLLVQLDIGHDN